LKTNTNFQVTLYAKSEKDCGDPFALAANKQSDILGRIHLQPCIRGISLARKAF